MSTFFADELPDIQDEAAWLIKPYIPREGVVFLYGKKGVGKSPLSWALAQSVATGAPWLGHAVQDPGPVLYLEVDTPLPVVSARMRQALKSHSIRVHFPPGSLADVAGWERFKREAKAWEVPKLVIVNTLRKVHAAKDTDSNIPALVYSRFRAQWPASCIYFNHHEKKTPANPDHQFSLGEEFSGSLAWANDAQVVLRLWRRAGGAYNEGRETILSMSGNQIAPQAGPLRFYLKDGQVGDLVPQVKS